MGAPPSRNDPSRPQKLALDAAENPSGTNAVVTASALSAALALKANTAHTHDTGDIASGVLPVARGGTNRGALGTAGQVLAVNAAGTDTEWKSVGGGLTKFAESENTAAPNATKPVNALAVLSGATDADFALLPKGNGAYLAQIPDDTAVGGAKRGAYAVDFQRLRTNSLSYVSHVAGGLAAFIGNGENNKASATLSAVVNGTSNQSTANQSFIGNGTANNSGGANSAILNGQYCGTPAEYSTVLNGFNCTADGAYSVAMGAYAIARGVPGRIVFAPGRFAVNGDAQSSFLALAKETANEVATRLWNLRVGGALYLPNNSVHRVRAEVVAFQPATADTRTWTLECLVKKAGTAASTALVGAVSTAGFAANSGAGTTNWIATLVANTTDGTLDVQVTGEAAKTIRWVATVYTVEVG